MNSIEFQHIPTMKGSYASPGGTAKILLILQGVLTVSSTAWLFHKMPQNWWEGRSTSDSWWAKAWGNTFFNAPQKVCCGWANMCTFYRVTYSPRLNVSPCLVSRLQDCSSLAEESSTTVGPGSLLKSHVQPCHPQQSLGVMLHLSFIHDPNAPANWPNCNWIALAPMEKISWNSKLVGGFNPSEKYEFVSWDDEIPNRWKNIKIMLQTTNQHLLYLPSGKLT